MRIVELAPILAERALREAAGRAAPAARDAAVGLKALVDGYERTLILDTLAACGGNQRRAARRLRVLASTLHEKIKRLEIRFDRVRGLRDPGGSDLAAALLWKGRLAPGGTLEVRGLNGQVRIDASEDEAVEVTARHTGPRGARAQIEVKVVEHRHGLSVCALRFQADRAAAGTADGGAAAVNLVARVPPDVHVIASTINGDVEVVGVSGNVEAGTTNGRVILLPATG